MTTDAEMLRSTLAPLMEHALEGIWVVDLSGNTVWANERVCSIVQLPLASFQGRPVHALVHEADRPRMPDALIHRGEGRSPGHELRIRRSDGQLRTVQVLGSPLRDAAGAIWAGMGFVRDLTDIRQERAELDRTAEFLTALLRNAPAAVIVIDASGLVEF